MKQLLIATSIALTLASPVFAKETPHRGYSDARIRTVAYDPNQVVHINGVYRSALQIEFSPYETITHVALGDTVSWEVAPVGNILFLKARSRAHDTNLIVLTLIGGQTRSYNFDLSSRAGAVSSQSGNTMFSVRFKYPEDDRQIALASALVQAEQQRQLADAGVISAALDHAVIQGTRNLDYSVEGASELQPSEISDNGEFTVMRFPGHQDLPAFFGVNPDGSETIIPYDVRDDFVVIHQVAKSFRLRRGLIVLCVTNNAPSRNDNVTRTGTASNVVDRVVKEQPNTPPTPGDQ